MEEDVRNFFEEFINEFSKKNERDTVQIDRFLTWAKNIMGIGKDPFYRERTALELHLIDYCKADDVLNLAEQGVPTKYEHLLTEFVHAYEQQKDGKSVYAFEEGDQKLIDSFLEIAKADIDHSYEYNSEDFINVVITALDRFGL